MTVAFFSGVRFCGPMLILSPDTMLVTSNSNGLMPAEIVLPLILISLVGDKIGLSESSSKTVMDSQWLDRGFLTSHFLYVHGSLHS